MRPRPYLQNNYSLIFQFIVSEYLAISKIFIQMEEALVQKNEKKILSFLTQLLDFQTHRLSISSVFQENGRLPRLQHNCQYFSLSEKGKSSQKLIEYVQKITRLCSQLWKMIEKEEGPPPDLTAMMLLLILPKINEYLKKMGRVIEKLFYQFVDDETVLLFLLQNHSTLDVVFQQPFVSKVFTKIFSKGLPEAEKFILQQYSQRGYHSLIAKIKEAFRELQEKNHNEHAIKYS